MKQISALLLALSVVTFANAAEQKPATPAPAKAKGPAAKADLEICCDDDAKPAADAKTAKAAEQKADAAKKEAPKPVEKK
jgi:hypothetical protein